MVYAHPRICPGEWDTQTVQGFWDTNRSYNLGQTTIPYNNQQRNCKIVDFAILVDNKVKLKEREKKDLARKLKKQTVEHENDGNTIFTTFTNPSARAGYDTRSIFKRS